MGLTLEALESVHGRSAAGLCVRLETLVVKDWVPLAECTTDEFGRIDDWHGHGESQGLYQLVFDVDRYFCGLGVIPVCSEVVTTFRVFGGQTRCRVFLHLSLHHYVVAFT
ncbi:hydroxyisourate hydrolase [Streptomyces sp. NPDC048566]|uniref:hydroxyisourate hydrolase n=1 Tax=Streptomyces sp. NPDC048566 TaxID=3365569 RepID=UPI00371E5BB5